MEQRNAQANGLLGRKKLRRIDPVDLTVEAFRTLGWGLLRQAALPTFYCIAVMYFLIRFVLADFFKTTAGASSQHELTEVAVRVGVMMFVGAPLLVLGVAYMFGLASAMVGDWVGGLVPDPDSAAKRARQSLIKVCGAILYEVGWSSIGFLLSLGVLFWSSTLKANEDLNGGEASSVVLVGILGLCIAAVFLAYRWVMSALVVPIILNEELAVSKVAKRSRVLLTRVGGRMTGANAVVKLLITLFIIELALSTGFGVLYSWAGLEGWIHDLVHPDLLRSICIGASKFGLEMLVFWVALPFGAVGRAVIYYERRVRLEGLDIELMARAAWRTERRARFEL